MKRYAALCKLMIVILFFVVGSYCIGVVQQDEFSVNSLQKTISTVGGMTCSLAAYCYKLGLEVFIQLQKFFYHQENNVKIQAVAVHDEQQSEDFYLDNEKCSGDGKEDCLFNQRFFGDSYFAVGPENIDPLLSFDYSQDPVVK